MRAVRTTIDLPNDLHRVMAALARDRGQTLSQTVADLLELALGDSSVDITVSEITGLPVVRLGRPVTSEDVRSLEDE
jgi:macrodomain Ter protein organizer (MatP/YcbG family)